MKTFSSRVSRWLSGDIEIEAQLQVHKRQYVRELNAYYEKNKRYPDSLSHLRPRTENLVSLLPLAYEERSPKLGYRIIFPDCRLQLLYHSLQKGQGFAFTYCDEREVWTASYGIIFYKGEEFTALEPFFDTKTYEVYDTYLLLKLDPEKFMDLGQLYRIEKGRILAINGGFNIWNP
jgi:hypothetical protein